MFLNSHCQLENDRERMLWSLLQTLIMDDLTRQQLPSFLLSTSPYLRELREFKSKSDLIFRININKRRELPEIKELHCCLTFYSNYFQLYVLWIGQSNNETLENSYRMKIKRQSSIHKPIILMDLKKFLISIAFGMKYL